jgi:lycopene cyclase domain-containing protein
MTGLTYLQFHVAFLVMALLILVPIVAVSRPRVTGPVAWEGNEYWGGVAIIVGLALVYTVPWDNYLIAEGVWTYGDGKVLTHLWLAPIEEYLFIMVQPVLTALWLSHLAVPEWDDAPLAVTPRVAAGFGGVVLGALGVGLLLLGPSTLYLGAILAWAAPVLVLQWSVGGPQLWQARRTIAVGTLVPTVYLCVADRIALSQGIWELSTTYTTGLTPWGLPIEEATFFLVTNLFVVQGLVLFHWVLDRWGIWKWG